MKHIIADSFEFMENDSILEEKGFKIYKKEKVDRKIIMLWRRLKLIQD
ncbi:MAG: hypothetical protein ABIA78_01140 [archaeon]